MYQDSGLFLRGGSGVGFAARRMERRMEQGVAATRAWRTRDGAVLRLLPDRLATLAAEVKAAVPSGHPAAADPHTAVREHVAALVRAARPAGTVTDHATGRALHVFRAPGRVGEMEIVTTPPRGPVFDIVEVRPAGGVNSEMEVYQDGAPGSVSPTGVRVRGPHATLTWTRVALAQLHNWPANLNCLNCVYVLTWRPTLQHVEVPRYVGETGNLRERWTRRLDVLRVFEADTTNYFLWAGTVAANAVQVHYAGPNQAPGPEALIRKDIEHVLIRRINEDLAQMHLPLLTNRRSTAPVLSDPQYSPLQLHGIALTNLSPHGALPWFIDAHIDYAAGTEFELGDATGLQDGAG